MTRFRFVSEHRAYGVKRVCGVLGVSRSGYYDWCRRPPSLRATRNAELTGLIREIHRRSRTTYGAPRVHAELLRLGEVCAKKRVARLMAKEGLVGAHARRKWRTGKPDIAPAPDLVKRNFGPPRPDRVWAADVTQFRTEEGWLHFAGVVDLYSRRVVGWSMGTSADADLVIDALVMAFERRRPDRGVIHHSDRGAAYTSLAFGNHAAELGIARSAPPVTASTTQRSRRSGPPSSGSWHGSTAAAPGRHETCCARRSSTTSKASTTPRGRSAVSVTVHQLTARRCPSLRNPCAEDGVNRRAVGSSQRAARLTMTTFLLG